MRGRSRHVARGQLRLGLDEPRFHAGGDGHTCSRTERDAEERIVLQVVLGADAVESGQRVERELQPLVV